MAAHRRLLSFFLCLSVRLCGAAITVHYVPGQEPLSAASSTNSAAAADYTGAAAYNPIRLEAPPIPNPLPAMAFPIQLQNGGTQGVSIPQNGGFLGFSIEMSVANQVRECTFHFVDSVFLLIPFASWQKLVRIFPIDSFDPSLKASQVLYPSSIPEFNGQFTTTIRPGQYSRRW